MPQPLDPRERNPNTFRLHSLFRVRNQATLFVCLSLPECGNIHVNNICNITFRFFYVFSTVHHSIGLFLQPTLMHTSITTCMSQYYPRHVSGLDMPILRRNNCTNTASGILQSAFNRCSVQPLMRARIPDAVFVQLFLLRMGMSRPETCRG